MRIMLVDDDSEILEMLHGFVSEFLGHECLSVSSVSLALENLESFKPQLIITDQNMPDQLGTDLIRQVKERAPYVSIIMLSAESQLTVAVEAMRLGADDFVPKPANVDDLDAAIKRVQAKWHSLPSAAEMEALHIENVLAHYETVAKAAEKLGMNASTIWRKRKSKLTQAA